MCESILSGNGRSGMCWLAVAAWCPEWPFLPPPFHLSISPGHARLCRRYVSNGGGGGGDDDDGHGGDGRGV